MAALNSLAYLMYSILTLAAHHKQTSYFFLNVEPDQAVWAQQDPYDKVEPDETTRSWRAKQDPDLPRIDPDESVWAQQDPDLRRVEPDESVWAQQDPDFPRVDPDESVWAQQDPDFPRVEPDESIWAQQDPDFPRVDPDEDYLKHKNPRIDPDETSWAKQDPDIRIDPDDSVWAEQDPDTLNVEPDFKAWAKQDPDHRRDKDSRCPPNEVYRKCETYCGSDGKHLGPTTICPKICIHDCVCRPGYVRGRHESCIKPQEYSSLNDEQEIQSDFHI